MVSRQPFTAIESGHGELKAVTLANVLGHLTTAQVALCHVVEAPLLDQISPIQWIDDSFPNSWRCVPGRLDTGRLRFARTRSHQQPSTTRWNATRRPATALRSPTVATTSQS